MKNESTPACLVITYYCMQRELTFEVEANDLEVNFSSGGAKTLQAIIKMKAKQLITLS